MKMGEFTIWMVLIFSMVGATYGAGFFTIIGPQTHQLEKPYRAYLVATGYSRPTGLKISLFHKDYQPAVETVKLIDGLEKEIEFELLITTNIESLTLKAEYLDTPGSAFEQTIKVIQKKYSVLIQTDKMVYKPGDKVQFRVVVLDAELKPYPYNSLNIKITDGQKQLVATRKASRSVFGLHIDSLQLASELNYGKWAIALIVDSNKNEVHKQNFEVIDYQLPQFEVYVDVVAKDVLLSNKVIQGEVYSKYAFGNGAKFVKGEVTLVASAFNPEKPDKVVTTKAITTSGTGDKRMFTVNLARDLNLIGQLNQTLVKLEATFTDDLTKRSLKGSTNIIVHEKNEYRFEIMERKQSIIPGQKYRAKIRVKSFDGKSAQGKKLITVHYGAFVMRPCNNITPVKKRKLRFVPIESKQQHLINGIAELEVLVPENSEAIFLQLNYEDFEFDHKVYRFYTKTGENLDVSVAASLKLGGNVIVKARSTHGMSKLYSVVIGRGGIVHTQSDDVFGERNFDIEFKAKPSMLPFSKLIVYYIQHSGEVVYDLTELKFDTWTGNYINIVVPKSAEADSVVEISVQTSPSSFVGLMASDRRSLLLASGNIIDESKLNSEISFFTFSDVYNKSDQSYLYSNLGLANAIILTDANKGARDCTVERLGEEEDDYNLDDIPSSKRITRSYEHPPSTSGFPETWFFKNYTVGRDGRIDLHETVPPTLTSYVISGFSINPELGFGLAQPKQLGVSKDFFIELNLPSSAFVDDVIKVEIFVFYYISTSSSRKTTVTLQSNEDFDVLALDPGKSCKFVPTDNYKSKIDLVDGGAAKTHFFIRPKKAGILKITATAKLNGVGEVTTYQNTFIDETGMRDGKVKAKLFDLRKREHDSTYFHMMLSDDAAEGSEQLEAFVSGNVMASGIETKIYGSDGSTGEKILNYVAAAYSIQYLKATKQINEMERSLSTVESGYQFVQSRKLNGNNRGYIANAGDEKASLVATAQVAKFLAIVKDFVSVLDINIVGALDFLKGKQTRTGQFATSSESVFGSVSKEVAHTALIALAFLENAPYKSRYQVPTKKALDFISSKFDEVKADEYTLAIAAYALVLGEHESASVFLDELFKTVNKDKENMFWNGTSSSLQISTAAYAILALEKLDRVAEAPKILNWLLSKRDEDGGFQSSEDTVVGIQAVAAMAVHFHSDHQHMNLYIYNEKKFKIPIFVDHNYKAKTYHVPTPTGATVNANGTGTAFVQMTQRYSVKTEKEDKFSVTVHPTAGENNLRLRVCIKRVRGESDMVVVEVRLPGGYEFNEFNFDESKVKSVHTRKNKSLVVIALENADMRRPYCVDIDAISFYAVSSSTPLPVKVYDGDDKDRYSVKFYSLPATGCQ